MKVEYINPFITSTVNVFSTMMGVTPKKTDLFVKEAPEASYDVSAMIGLSGNVTGVVTLSFPKDCALKVVSRFIGSEIKILDREVADGIGELVNIISGGAKSDLNKLGLGLSIALPNVVIGKSHQVWRTRDVPCICILFECDLGKFSIEVSLK